MDVTNDLTLRLVFMGTPDLARTVLATLSGAPWAKILAVVCQPDRPSGRHLHPTPPPVKVEALKRGLEVHQPLKARDPAFLETLRNLAPDLIVVAAYGQLLPPALLAIPRFGCLNVHTSLLPRWRGAAPIQWAIASGDLETGVTLMKMDAGLDTGPTLGTLRTPILPEDNSQTLHDRLARLGGDLLLQYIPDYVSGRIQPQPQPVDGVTLARKITKEDGRIDWQQSAQQLMNRFRAFTPWPGFYCHWTTGGRTRLLKVHATQPVDRPEPARPGEILPRGTGKLVVACGEGALNLTEVQLEGGKRLLASEFLLGHSNPRLE